MFGDAGSYLHMTSGRTSARRSHGRVVGRSVRPARTSVCRCLRGGGLPPIVSPRPGAPAQATGHGPRPGTAIHDNAWRLTSPTMEGESTPAPLTGSSGPEGQFPRRPYASTHPCSTIQCPLLADHTDGVGIAV